MADRRTFRTEFASPWVGQAHVTSLTVNRRGEHEVAAIIGHLVGNKQLAADVMAEIVERTDGATEPSARIDVSGRSSANRR